MYRLPLGLLFFCFLYQPLRAQLPPGQPEQDCIGAIPVCQNLFVQTNSYQLEGNNPLEINGFLSCMLLGERNDVWYILTVQTDGELAFTLTPQSSDDDYDWAVYNLTGRNCSEIFLNGSLEVSCNFAGQVGPTGPNGQPGITFEPTIPVQAGETYVINVSNFSGSIAGYTLDFNASTASVFDDVTPQINELNVDCSGEELELVFSENIPCSEVAPEDFVVVGPGGGTFGISSITSVNCEEQGKFDNIYTLTLDPPLPGPGDYRLAILGFIEDNCGNTVPNDTLALSFDTGVSNPDISISRTDICTGDTVTIEFTGTAPANSFFDWDFGATASVLSGDNAGPYEVFWLTEGDREVCLSIVESGCTTAPICETVSVTVEPDNQIAPFDSQCFEGHAFSFAPLEEVAGDTYSWSFGPDASVANSTDMRPGGITFSTAGTKTVSLQVTRGGCVSEVRTETFELVNSPEVDFTISDLSSCLDTCVTFTYTGTVLGPSQTYSWNFGEGAVPQTSGLADPDCVDYLSGGKKEITLTVNFEGCEATLVEEIELFTVPVVEAGGDTALCEGEAGVQLNPTITGGTAPLTYAWTCNQPNVADCGISDPSIEDPVVSPAIGIGGEGIVYYLTVSDNNGCVSQTDSVIVTAQPRPIVRISDDKIICEEGPGVVIRGGVADNNQAPEPFTYTWSPEEGLTNPNTANPFARPETTTTYSLTLTSINGCASDPEDPNNQVTVFVNPLPVVTARTDTTICEGDTLLLSGTASGAGPDYTYSWTPVTTGYVADSAAIQTAASPDFTTVYFFTATSEGCTSRADSVRVIVEPSPTVNAGPDMSICLGEETTLLGNAVGNGLTYRWLPESGLSDPAIAMPTAQPDTTTTYSLQVISDFGCGSSVDEVRVLVKPSPLVDVGIQDTTLCEGDTLALTAAVEFTTTPEAPVNYVWQPRAGILGSPLEPSVLLSPTIDTQYFVTASISGDCPNTDSINIRVVPSVFATATADTTRICEGSVTRLRATGSSASADIIWVPPTGLDDPSSADPLASPTETTTYKAVIEEAGCTDSSAVTIEVLPLPSAEIASTETGGCQPLTVFFTETGEDAVSYIWDFGDGSPISNEMSPTHVYEVPGMYDVILTATGIGGCSNASDALTITVSDSSFANFTTEPPASATLVLPESQMTFIDLSENAVEWLWDFGDGNSSTEMSPTHTYEEAGEYIVTLTVTDAGGCVSQFTLGPIIVLSPELFIPNVFSPNEDGVNDRFVVRYTGVEVFRLEVYDRWGRQYYDSNLPDEGWPGTHDNGELAPEGVYYYHLKIGGKDFTGNITLLR